MAWATKSIGLLLTSSPYNPNFTHYLTFYLYFKHKLIFCGRGGLSRAHLVLYSNFYTIFVFIDVSESA